MPTPLLLEHHALITLKKSSLSSTQRKRVVYKVAFLLDKGKITEEDINLSINKLKEKYGQELTDTD